MSLTEPNSEIYLLKTPIELDNNNQLNFSNSSTQHSYFSGCPKINISKATFQRKDGFLRYPANMESVLEYNYCMYRNKNHGNKWFYAFVTGVEWLSENSCAISLKTDVWQTWQFDLTWHPCFVEREHVNDDTFGKHTIPEGLEYGEYIINSATSVDLDSAINECYIVAQVSQLCDGMESVISGTRVYNGVPQGCWLIGIPIYIANQLNFANLDNFIRMYDDFHLADAIVSMFIVPGKMVSGSSIVWTFNITNPDTSHVWQWEGFGLPSSTTAIDIATTTISKPTAIDGYSPKNNKCLCSPYNYLLASNNAGSTVAYAYELFSSTPEFKTRGVLTQGCDIKATPTNYKSGSLSSNYDYSITAGKFPMLSWNSDYYLNWIALNGSYQEVQATLTPLEFGWNLVAGLFTGNFAGANPVGLGKSVADQLQQLREARMTPDSAKGNLTGGDINYTLEKIGFTFYKMTVRAEYIKTIDDYFSCYGYKVNSLKTPNITGRTYWNYVKTIGCNVTANAPQEDIEEIRGLFDRGITIWHNPSYFLDYTQNNSIVTP